MFQEDDNTRNFLYVVRLFSWPFIFRPENYFPDFWCLCDVWMNINGHINRPISLDWRRGITLLCREREEGAAGWRGSVSSTPQVARLIVSHQPVGGRQSSSYPEAAEKQVNWSPLHLPSTVFKFFETGCSWSHPRTEMRFWWQSHWLISLKIYAHLEEVLKSPDLTNRAV